tara:strand:- start:30 stop:515 length:486 start_codon:yes stop_codon:yes gene_type:complete
MKFFKLKINKSNSKKNINNIKLDPFIEIGNIIKEERIKKQLSLEDLAKISKIPITTIDAIENNIKELIPQYPFLRSILLKLEDCLYLEKFKLINLNNKKNFHPTKKKIKKDLLIKKFDLINSWYGTILYILVLLISIFILNRYFLNIRVIEFKYIEKNINN